MGTVEALKSINIFPTISDNSVVKTKNSLLYKNSSESSKDVYSHVPKVIIPHKDIVKTLSIT